MTVNDQLLTEVKELEMEKQFNAVELDNLDNLLLEQIMIEEAAEVTAPKATTSTNGMTMLPSLSSRLRLMAHDAMAMGNQHWHETYTNHPGYNPVVTDIVQMIRQRGFEDTLDYIENIGCEVVFDRSTRILTIGLGESMFKNMNKEYDGYSSRNGKLIRRINEVAVNVEGDTATLATNQPVVEFSRVYYMNIHL